MDSKRGVKRKKITNLEADQVIIDNTAPLPEIIHNLYHREVTFSKPYRLYHQLLAQRRYKGIVSARDRELYHFALPGHPLNAFTEDYDGEINYCYFEQFPYKSLLPKYISTMKHMRKDDPVTELLKNKYEWMIKIRQQKAYHRHPEKENSAIYTKILANPSAKRVFLRGAGKKIEQLSEKVMRVPQHLVDLAAHIDSDPDVNFTDSYNWYYSGSGNLQLVCIHWVDYLLHSEFSLVSITRFHKQLLTIDYDDTTSFDCGDNILETICSSGNILAVRTKLKIFILKIIDNDGKLQLEKLKSFDSELPFMSIAFDKVHTNILYVTDLNCKLTIVNIDRMTGKTVQLKKTTDSLVNNWNTVIGVSRGVYMHVDKNAIAGYDKRTHTPVDTWDGVSGIVDEVDCNALSSAFQVEDSPNLYFTTEHHLFLMDSRCSRKNKLKVVQRWTHGMQCVPTYISVRRAETNKELVFLSSQWCEDMCVVSNYADRLTRTTDIDGVAMPYRPPSVFNALFEARQKLLCMNVSNPIDARLAYSITGKIEFDDGDKIVVLMQNSVGDISNHTLYPFYMENLIEDDAVQQLDIWANTYKNNKKPFEITGVYDISNIWKELRKMPEEFDGIKADIVKVKDMPSEKEIIDVFRNEEVLPELLDAWDAINKNPDQSFLDLNINVHSDGEESPCHT